MKIRQAQSGDFNHLETFVWQAIFPAFDVDGLTEAQRKENDLLVETARDTVLEALGREEVEVFVAIDPKTRALAGYIIADGRSRSYAELTALFVKRAYWGKGISEQLLNAGLDSIGRHRPVSVAVRYFNERAIAFFAKHGFQDTGEAAGNHAIPRLLLALEAEEFTVPEEEMTDGLSGRKGDGPSDLQDLFSRTTEVADGPVYEALPDFTLSKVEEPLAAPGDHNLSTAPAGTPLFEETTLDDRTISELEAFIAKAKARRKLQRATSPSELTKQPGSVVSQSSTPAQPEERKTSKSIASSDQGKVGHEVGQPAIEEAAEHFTAKPAASSFAEPSFSFVFEEAPQTEPRDTTISQTSKAIELEITNPESVQDERPSLAGDSIDVERETPDTQHIKEKKCEECATPLPLTARFCFNCGSPQHTTIPAASDTNPLSHGSDPVFPENHDESESEEDKDSTLLLADLESNPEDFPLPGETPDVHTESVLPDEKPGPTLEPDTAKSNPSPFSLSGLKQDFRLLLTKRITNYFGSAAVPGYISKLEADYEFQQVRDSSLSSLYSWLKDHASSPHVATRIADTQADLVEFFLVETARDLHRNAFPQRLLRYQSVNKETVDIFRLVVDYLDFDNENDLVYTDFVSMPPRALKNATQSFLKAAKDERILFICDQSLISQAKNGFALTDSGIYWKNIFQPAGQAVYKLMKAPTLSGGHVVIDGQYFDAGASLNLKIALLLDKLRRL